MDHEIYTVPDEVLFRNFEVLSHGSIQTRSLLLQNKTRHPLTAYVSNPFTDHFKIHASDLQQLGNGPSHVSLTVQPGVPAKLTLELRKPESEELNYIQDLLVIVMGSTVLTVPMKAVRQSLDPAGGAQLKAIIKTLPFWPCAEELQSASAHFMGSLNLRLSSQFKLPQGELASPGISEQVVMADAPLAIGAAARSESATARREEVSSAGARAAATPQLPPDSFTEAKQVSGESNEALEDELSVPAEPIIFRRPMVVQGRTAVVVGPSVSGTQPAAAGARPSGPDHLSVAATAVAASPCFSRSGSRSGSGRSASSRPDTGNNCAFLLNGRYHDSRGRDVTTEVLAGDSPWKVVDLHGTARLGSGSGTSSNPTVEQQQGRGTASTARLAEVTATTGRAGSACVAQGAHSVRAGDGIPGGKQDALAAAMKELGLSHLPPAAGAAGGEPSTSLVDMRLRPRSGGQSFGRQPGSGGGGSARALGPEDGELDLEGDFEARLQRNIDMGMPPGGHASTTRTALSSAGAASSPPMSRSPALAPLPRRMVVGTDGAKPPRPMSAAAEAQMGYGGEEDELDARLQQHLDRQMSSGAIGSRSSCSRAAVAVGRGSVVSSRTGAGSPGSKKVGVGSARGSPVSSVASAASKFSISAKSDKLQAAGSFSGGPNGAGVRRAGFSSKSAEAPVPKMVSSSRQAQALEQVKPSKERLRSMQAAWDAL